MDLHVAERFEPGAILVHSWGYDQTNIDWFAVVKRAEKPNGQVWVTIVELDGVNLGEDSFMSGKCRPGAVKPGGRKLRRKVHVWNGEERGFSIERGYGWCRLWEGAPATWSAYA